MVVIGILGGVGSGKSFVSTVMGELGAKVLDGDRIAHEVLREPSVKDEIRGRWGDSVFDSHGNVDRSALARIVFAPPPDGPPQLAELETLTHPEIEQRIRNRIDQLRGTATRVVVLDAAVMLKAGWDRHCDRIIFVDASRAVRLGRARQRGWNEASFSQREAAQEPLSRKRSRADHVIDNGSTEEHTRNQVHQLWKSLNVDASSSSIVHPPE